MRIISYTQKEIFNSLITGNTSKLELIKNKIEKAEFIRSDNTQTNNIFLSDFNDNAYKERFNNIVISSCSLNNPKYKNYKEINNILMILFKYTNEIEVYINNRISNFQYFFFILISLLYILVTRHLLGLISIGFFVLCLIFKYIQVKINKSYSSNYYKTQKEVFTFTEKCFSNYNLINYFNFNIHADFYYSKLINNISTSGILTQTYFISLFQSIQISIVLSWISFSFYAAAQIYDEITIDYGILSPIFCFLFGIIGLKLNEINKNYAFGCGVDNKYKSSIINLYLPLYLKDKYDDLADNNSFSMSEKNSNNASINGVTMKDNKLGMTFSVKEKIISKINNQYLLSCLITDYFFKSKTCSKNKLNLLRNYCQLLNMLNNKSEIGSDINESNAHDTFTTTNKGISAQLNTIGTFKNHFIYSNLLLNKPQINLSNILLEKTEFIAFCGDLSAHQILKSLEDAYLIETSNSNEKIKKENDIVEINNINNLSLFSSSYVLHDNLNLRENIICGLNSKEYFRRILNKEYSNKLYAGCIEICSLSSLTQLNVSLDNASNKDSIKISFARSIFKDADIILVDDILQTISNNGVEILNTYFKSDIFKQKPRLVICASNRRSLLEYCSNIILVKEDKIIGNYSSFNELQGVDLFVKEYSDL